MRQLAARGHQIGLFSLANSKVRPDHLAEVASFCEVVELFPFSRWDHLRGVARAAVGRLPLQVGYFYKRELIPALVEKLDMFQPDQLVCQLIRMSEYARAWPGPKTLDYMDAFSFIFQKRAEEASFLIRPFLQMEERRLERYEEEVFPAFEKHWIISERDRKKIAVSTTELIRIIPNGVETDHFVPMGAEKARFDLVFVGNLGYHPNVEAVHWFVREVLPGLRRLRPGLRLLIAGARPSASIRRLADAQIKVSGWLPDIRDGYAAGKIFVAPLFHGGGQQNKLLEAMSMGLPCVTTSRVNASLQAPEGVGVLEADRADEFLAKIHFLLDNPEQARQIGMAGRAFVQHRFTWEKSADRMEQELLGSRQPKKPYSHNS